MIDYARPPYDAPSMCDIYFSPPPAAPARLDDFQVFKKGTASHIYGNYYSDPSYDSYADPDIESTESVYVNLLSFRECHRDDWKKKFVSDWNEDDTVSWFIETLQYHGISEYEVPFHNFRMPGLAIKNITREEMQQRMLHPSIDPAASGRLADRIYEKLQRRINDDFNSQHSAREMVFRYADSNPLYEQEEPMNSLVDLDKLEQHRNRGYMSDYRPNDSSLMQRYGDSSDEADDVFRSSETASPECSYGSEGSKSGDEDDKRKIFKRPPGRPKGSTRKMSTKRPKSVSVPEFLRNLLMDPRFCPSIIKWEDYSQGKFRFVKPDVVAKLWGEQKQNENMTFEKFSRAMRYHYRQAVLVSVPTARLVYQFGHKGPDFKTDNPNFAKVKTEL